MLERVDSPFFKRKLIYNLRARARARMHTRIHPYKHTHTHIHARTHARTHTSLNSITNLRLRALRRLHVEALRPFHITSRKYERMKYGHRKKTDIFRLSRAKHSVYQKIAILSSEHNRTICITALNDHLSNSLSSYRKFTIWEMNFFMLIQTLIYLMCIHGRG